MTERTCNKCGRVAFGVTRDWAEDQVRQFNEFLDRATQETKDAYGNRRATIGAYERCMECGAPHTNFRDAVDGDCPIGCTLSPIIVEF